MVVTPSCVCNQTRVSSLFLLVYLSATKLSCVIYWLTCLQALGLRPLCHCVVQSQATNVQTPALMLIPCSWRSGNVSLFNFSIQQRVRRFSESLRKEKFSLLSKLYIFKKSI